MNSCQGKTRSGKMCTRKTQTSYCWQHQPKLVENGSSIDKRLEMESLKSTIAPNSYWNGNGVYQKEYQSLFDLYVPTEGKAETICGELLRAISRLSYEYYNNGNCNARERCFQRSLTSLRCYQSDDESDDESDDDSDQDYEVKIDSFYKEKLDLIKETIPELKKQVEEIEEIILIRPDDFTDYNRQKYNDLSDQVIYYVLKKEKGTV
jgi:hypothetical protein